MNMTKVKFIIIALIAIFAIPFECNAELYRFDGYYINDKTPKNIKEKVEVSFVDYKGLSSKAVATIDFHLWDSKIGKWKTVNVIITEKPQINGRKSIYKGHLKKDSRVNACVYVDTSTKGQISFTLVAAGTTIEVKGPIRKG